MPGELHHCWGRQLQIRTSGKGSYIPIHGGEGLLLVVRIRRTTIELIYGGPANAAWDIARKPNNRGVRSISLTTLKKLHSELAPSLQIKRG